MNEYQVLKSFDRHEKGDSVTLNAMQAKHLLLSGFIKFAPKKKRAKSGGDGS